MSDYKRLTIRREDYVDMNCDNCTFIEKNICSYETSSEEDCLEMALERLAELEDKIEGGEIGNISPAIHRTEAADMVIKELRKKLSKAEHDRDRYQRRMEVMKRALLNMCTQKENKYREFAACSFGKGSYTLAQRDDENVKRYFNLEIEQAEKELSEERK